MGTKVKEWGGLRPESDNGRLYGHSHLPVKSVALAFNRKKQKEKKHTLLIEDNTRYSWGRLSQICTWNK